MVCAAADGLFYMKTSCDVVFPFFPEMYAFSERKKAKKIRSVFQQNKTNLLKKNFILFEFSFLKKHTFMEPLSQAGERDVLQDKP